MIFPQEDVMSISSYESTVSDIRQGLRLLPPSGVISHLSARKHTYNRLTEPDRLTACLLWDKQLRQGWDPPPEQQTRTRHHTSWTPLGTPSIDLQRTYSESARPNYYNSAPTAMDDDSISMLLQRSSKYGSLKAEAPVPESISRMSAQPVVSALPGMGRFSSKSNATGGPLPTAKGILSISRSQSSPANPAYASQTQQASVHFAQSTTSIPPAPGSTTYKFKLGHPNTSGQPAGSGSAGGKGSGGGGDRKSVV